MVNSFKEAMASFVAKGMNRAQYLFMIVLVVGRRADDTVKYSFEQACRCAGLLQEIARNKAIPATRPLVIPVDNTTGEALPREEVRFLRERGYALSKDKMLLDLESPAMGMLWGNQGMFTNAVKASGYLHSLTAPLVPHGYISDVNVVVRTITTVKDGKVVPSLADGSGLVHWDCLSPELRELLRQDHGVVGDCQFRLIAEPGDEADAHYALAKGMVRVSSESVDSLGNPCWTIDPVQFKGRASAWADKLVWNGEGEVPQAVLSGCHIGILAHKPRPSKMAGGFEFWENLKYNPQTEALVKGLTQDAIAKLADGGVYGLLAEAARDDEQLQLMLKMFLSAEDMGMTVNPMSVPMVAGAVRETLQRKLWTIANGGSLKGSQAYIIMDDGVEAGTVITGAMPVGTTVVSWRFPIVHEAGLKVLKVVMPRMTDLQPISAEEEVEWVHGEYAAVRPMGEVVDSSATVGPLVEVRPGVYTRTRTVVEDRGDRKCIRTQTVTYGLSVTTAICSPADVADQQGDDDGDIVALSSDASLVEAVTAYRLSSDRRAFEPVGEKVIVPLVGDDGEVTEEALDYLSTDPMVSPGLPTIGRSRLLAMGDTLGALAMSVCVQECVDSGKRRVAFTQFRDAMDPRMWKQDANGVLRLSVPRRLRTLMSEDEVAGEVRKFVAARKKLFLGDDKAKVLGWRTQTSSTELTWSDVNECFEPKRLKGKVDCDNWQWSLEKQTAEVGNLVHLAHDEAKLRWLQAGLDLEAGADIELRDFLPLLLTGAGFASSETTTSWTEYRSDLRVTSGLKQFGSSIRTAMSKQGDARSIRVEAAYSQLHLDLRDLVERDGVQALLDIWFHETSVHGNVSHAFRAVAFPGSPVLALLDIDAPAACSFLTKEKVDAAVEISLARTKPFAVLDRMINSTAPKPAHVVTHESSTFDADGNPVAMAECSCCVKTLQDSLVGALRTRKGRDHNLVIKAMVSSLNAEDRSYRLYEAKPADIAVGDAERV